MPEGPSILLVKEATTKFVGQRIIAVDGNSKIEQGSVLDKKIIGIKSYGKHFLICLEDFTIRIHFLMFGSYTVDEKKPDRKIRHHLKFRKDEINFYAC